MKNIISQISTNMVNKFDQELLMLIKTDLLDQKVKIKNRLIHLSTVNFDNELYQIIKLDIQLIKQKLSNQKRTLAQAG